jgi:hypothetical protein
VFLLLMDDALMTTSINEMLNDKIRSLQDRSDADPTSVSLLKLRDQVQAEFEAYRRDAETTLNCTLADVQTQLEAGLRDRQALECERDNLKETIAKLQAQLNQQQAEVRKILRVAIVKNSRTDGNDLTDYVCSLVSRIDINKAWNFQAKAIDYQSSRPELRPSRPSSCNVYSLRCFRVRTRL